MPIRSPSDHTSLRYGPVKPLHRYDADDGALTVTQMRQIKKRSAHGKKRSVRSSLFGITAA